MSFTRPPYIVVDTTEFRADLTFGTRWTAVLSAGSHGLLNLRIPEIVRQETIRHYDRLIGDGEREAIKALNVIRRYSDWPDDLVDAEEIARICEQNRVSFPHALDDTVQQAGGCFLAMPEVDHATLLARALQGRKPFDANGKEGYRDALIWHSVLDLCRSLTSDDCVIFVTGNNRDFCDDETGSLARTLRDDLAELESPPTVTIFATLRAFYESCADALTALTSPPNRPPQHAPAPPNSDFLADQLGHVCAALIGVAIPSVDVPTPFDEAGLPDELREAFVRDIEEIGEPEMGAPVTPISDDVVTREIIQAAFVVLDSVVNETAVASYPSTEVNELTVTGQTTTPGMMHVHITRMALLTFHVTYDVVAGDISNARLAHVEYVPDVDTIPGQPELLLDRTE